MGLLEGAAPAGPPRCSLPLLPSAGDIICACRQHRDAVARPNAMDTYAPCSCQAVLLVTLSSSLPRHGRPGATPLGAASAAAVDGAGKLQGKLHLSAPRWQSSEPPQSWIAQLHMTVDWTTQPAASRQDSGPGMG